MENSGIDPKDVRDQRIYTENLPRFLMDVDGATMAFVFMQPDAETNHDMPGPSARMTHYLTTSLC